MKNTLQHDIALTDKTEQVTSGVKQGLKTLSFQILTFFCQEIQTINYVLLTRFVRSTAGVVPNSDPRQITTPLVLVGLGLGLGEGLGLSNQVAISTRGGNNLAGVENGHNTGASYRQSRRLPRASGFEEGPPKP